MGNSVTNITITMAINLKLSTAKGDLTRPKKDTGTRRLSHRGLWVEVPATAPAINEATNQAFKKNNNAPFSLLFYQRRKNSRLKKTLFLSEVFVLEDGKVFLSRPIDMALIRLSLPKYHVYIEYVEPDKSGIRFNINLEELNRTFTEPFNAGQPFWFMSRLLNPVKVNKAVIFWSYESADKLKLPNGEKLVAAKDKTYLIECVQKSKIKGVYVCTEKFVPQTDKNVFTPKAGQASRRVFVVSNADEEMKQAVTKTLSKLLLVPVVSREEPGHCRRIVEQPAEYEDVGFAVVLLSPDDYAYAKTDEPSKRRLRPNQEVVFELGYLLGKLGKEKVLVLFRETANFELPSCFENLKVTAFDDRGSWKLSLTRELAKNGYNIDAAKS